MLSDGLPFVSVVVPVYNGESCVAKNIESLLGQDYPKELYEIIIVDNGSTDRTKDIIQEYPVILLEENEVQTSYAARNKGIAYARGGIIAFTDADAVAHAEWISSGVSCLKKNNAEMVGGKVLFIFSDNRTPAEYLDSIINLHNESSIHDKGAAKTANVFVEKSLFSTLGMFKSDKKSGEDMAWTGRASHKGHKIVYCENAVVEHPARNFRELIEKHGRIGLGSVAKWKVEGRGGLWIILRFLSLFTPFLSFRVPLFVYKRGEPDVHYPIISMMMIAWVCSIATGCGIVKSWF